MRGLQRSRAPSSQLAVERLAANSGVALPGASAEVAAIQEQLRRLLIEGSFGEWFVLREQHSEQLRLEWRRRFLAAHIAALAGQGLLRDVDAHDALDTWYDVAAGVDPRDDCHSLLVMGAYQSVVRGDPHARQHVTAVQAFDAVDAADFMTLGAKSPGWRSNFATSSRLIAERVARDVFGIWLKASGAAAVVVTACTTMAKVGTPSPWKSILGLECALVCFAVVLAFGFCEFGLDPLTESGRALWRNARACRQRARLSLRGGD